MTKKTFTWKELGQHNTHQDALVAVRGKVYDVSQFIERHPGGRDVLLMAAGKDITMVFESYHALSENAPRVLEKYYVGELISSQYPTYPETGLFFKTARERVQKYFKDNKKDPKDPGWLWLRFILFPAILITIWYAQLTWLANHLLLSCLSAIVMGWFGALIAMTIVHDSSHFAVTHSPWVWKTLGMGAHNFMLGCSYYVWILQHTFGHHPYTNVDGADPDIATTEKHPDIRRIKDTQTWVPPYFYQHIYAPLIYGVLSLKTRLQDFFVVIKQRNSTMPMNKLPTSTLVLFYAGKLFFLTYKLIIPAFFLPLKQVILLNVLSDAVASYWLALIFQISHVVSEVDWPQPDKDNRINQDWAELQILTTLDYATDNWFWNTFTGALNHQTTHHLFPSISQVHYPQITPIVRKTCEEFNLRYNYIPTFTKALGAHIGHLKRLGQNEKKSLAG
ncbi:acyl-lipid (8-3)-desaturase-like [Actinia tenebrosa]|uniref:Acyl-lipid (8-3)-desaturase-like n=1 Tax=Actinia tenebrosa TaxID=6105 RepID=A0A6P8IDL5_ACTTE|nr:acyl-lipid (8-3)-desaturase-like [Actinia tenebrosa]